MKTVRFGIVGTGRISEWFLEGAAADSRFEARAVCSRSRERGEAFAARHGIRHVCTSVEEMAALADIDAVYIATPNSLHAVQAIECMNMGKHVLCEKPISSNAAECRMMIDCAKRNGVALMEGLMATMNPNFGIVKTQLARMGTIRRYFASYCQYSSRYDLLKHDGIVANAFNQQLSAGALMDIGVYTIYPMVALFGKPQSIAASAVMLPSEVDGAGAVNFCYDGMNATVIYSKIADSYLPSEIEGEEGTLLIDDIHSMKSVKYYPRGVASSGRGARPMGVEIGCISTMDDYGCETAEFIDMILAGRQSSAINSWEVSLAVHETVDEIRRQLNVVFPADSVVG